MPLVGVQMKKSLLTVKRFIAKHHGSPVPKYFSETKDFPNNTQLAIAIIHNGTTKFYGIKLVNDTIFTIDNHDNVFEIGSISEVITATLLADMVVNN